MRLASKEFHAPAGRKAQEVQRVSVTEGGAQGARPGFLVMVRNGLVAQDLSDTLREMDPSAEVLAARTCDEALMLLAGRSAIEIAFVEADPAQLAASALDSELRTRGGILVLLGDAAEDAWHFGGAGALRWPVLMRPFSSAMVMDLVRSFRVPLPGKPWPDKP